MVATGMRSARMQGTPLICFESTVIRRNFIVFFPYEFRVPIVRERLIQAQGSELGLIAVYESRKD